MNVLITGGTGFLGRHLVWRLAALGHKVTFTGRQRSAAEEVIRASSVPVHFVPLHHGDGNSAAQLLEAAEGIDALVHTAALSSPWGSEKAFYKANVASTQEVLSACAIARVARLVHISTPSLYFNYLDRLDIRENEALPAPVNEYARTKAQAETLVRVAGLDEAVILRPRALFGPWDNTLMPRLLRVIERGAIPLMRGGKAKLDITYIDNLVDAIVLSLTRPLPRALNIYNVTNGEPQYLDALLAKLAQQFQLPLRTRSVPWWLIKTAAGAMEGWSKMTGGKEPPITRYSAGVLAFSQTLDITAIRRDLGYEPRVSIDEGLRRHAQWYLQQSKGQTV